MQSGFNRRKRAACSVLEWEESDMAKSSKAAPISNFSNQMTRQKRIRDQADQANHEAVQGGIDGGIRWFLGGVIVFGTAQLVWPLYRGLTTPFKVLSQYFTG
jgi:hypothetical protein